MFRLAVAVLALVACALASDVVILTESNFDDVIKSNPNVLVEFFAPWCGHCKKLAPEYEVAATALKADGIVLASVDATEEKALGSKFGIKGYPTLKFFKNGAALDYTGGRTADTITSWLRKKTGPAAKSLADTAAVEAFKASAKITVVAYLAEASGAAFDAVLAAAGADDERTFAYTTDAAAAAAAGVSAPAVVLYKPFDELKNVLAEIKSQKAVADFVATNSIPLVIPFSMDVVGSIFQSPVGKVAFLFSEKEVPEFRAVAEAYKGKFVFATSDGSEPRLNQHVGLEKSDFPKLVILETGAQMKKFPTANSDVSEAALKAHVESYLAGALKPHFKSDKAPASNDGPVKIVTGNTFAELVLDESKDVLLEVYAPWCGHCKKLEPIWTELGESLAANKNIVIAKMDGTGNEVDGLAVKGFPTIQFFPAGVKKSAAAGQEYKGNRELSDFKTFLEQNAKAKADKHDEL